MTPRIYNPSKPDVPEFDTSRQQYDTFDNKRTAEILKERKFHHLVGAFDPRHQNSK